MAKKVLVIGAGIAGLAAASYLRRNGFETEIFESHVSPGGLCTAWQRDGFTFDGCIHWLMGSGPSSNLHQIWKELGAGDLEYIEWSIYTTVRLKEKDSFTVYTDPDALEAEMVRISPLDAPAARVVANGVRAFSRIDLPAAFDALSGGERLSLFAHLPGALFSLAPWIRKTVGEFVSQLKGPRLIEAFDALYGDQMRDMPLLTMFMMLGFMAKKSSGYPIGGSLAFARAIEKKYLDLGGAIRYGSRVDEVVVEGGAAVGLRGAWGEARGDYVVSAGDAHDLMTRLLPGHFAQPELDAAFQDMPRFPSLLLVSLGLDRDYSDQPHSLSIPLAAPLVLENGALVRDRLGVRFTHFDRTAAPAGKTAAMVMLETRNDDYWTTLYARSAEAYSEEKKKTADAVIAALDSAIPGLAEAVEVVDVSTPRSFIRYTGNWHGSYEGWLPIKSSMKKRFPRTVPGIQNLRLVGQWVNPGGGLPPCGIDGRRLAKELCKIEGIEFKSDL